jgi:hypothetical protein
MALEHLITTASVLISQSVMKQVGAYEDPQTVLYRNPVWPSRRTSCLVLTHKIDVLSLIYCYGRKL